MLWPVVEQPLERLAKAVQDDTYDQHDNGQASQLTACDPGDGDRAESLAAVG